TLRGRLIVCVMCIVGVGVVTIPMGVCGGGFEGVLPEDKARLTAEELRAFEGWYRSTELDSSYEIVAIDGALVAYHWRNAPATLTPSGGDDFAGDRGWLPQVRFTRDASGRLTGFTASGSRVRNMLFERQGSE
ncbi:MAG: hypothetical protein ACPHQP_10295, partial [Longimicrobiales bacterium]